MSLEDKISDLIAAVDRLNQTMSNTGESAPPSAPPSASGPKPTQAVLGKAEELGVDLDEVEGSGKNGRVTVKDVEKFYESSQALSEPSAPPAPTPQSPMPGTAPATGGAQNNPFAPPPQITLQQLQARCSEIFAAVSQAGRTDLASAMQNAIHKHGAMQIAEVPQEKWQEVLQEVEDILQRLTAGT